MIMQNELSRYSVGNSLGYLGSTVRSRSLAVLESALVGLLSPPRTTREQALAGMERRAALTHLTSSLEHLSRPRDRRVGGTNNWELSRGGLDRLKNPFMRSVVDFVSNKSITECLLVMNAGAALTMLAPTRSRWVRCAAASTMAGTSYLLSPRHKEGGDGSDQTSFLVQMLAAVARAAGGNDRIVDAALWAVSLQGAMSYAVSGWAKILGSSWRDGSALEGVLRTRSYGHERSWRLANRFPNAARLVCYGALALECTFPLAYVGRGRLAKPYVLGAAAFHLSVARVMGLNRFLTAFTSMHPAILYTARSRTDTIGTDNPGSATGGLAAGRSDTLVKAVAAAAVGAVVMGAVDQWRTRRKVDAGYGDEQWLHTSDGNRLAYRRRGAEGPDLPVFVCESGLQGVPESWEWVADELAGEGTVITYQRAGSGRSSALPNTAESVEELVGHAVALVDAVGQDRPVVLIGHSLGGYLALRVAERSQAEITALVLIDPTHPATVDAGQAPAASAVVATSKSMTRSIDLGLGSLIAVDFLGTLPPHVQAAAQTQYRDSRIWAAAEREWTAALRDFETNSDLPQLDIPVLVLTAQLTFDRHSTAGALHRDMATLGPDGRHEVLPGTSHISILHHRRGARRVARAITKFLDAAAAARGVAEQVAV